MYERAVSYLEHRIKYAPRGVDWIHEAMAMPCSSIAWTCWNP
jgi:hypothetical protein